MGLETPVVHAVKDEH